MAVEEETGVGDKTGVNHVLQATVVDVELAAEGAVVAAAKAVEVVMAAAEAAEEQCGWQLITSLCYKME